MPEFEVVKFSEAYDFAQFTWSYLTEGRPDEVERGATDLLSPQDDEVIARLLKPHRDSLLHLFLRRLYTAAYIEEFEHHRNDMLDLVAEEYEAVLTFNGVPFRRSTVAADTAEEYERKALRRVTYLRKRLPLHRIAQDTFQLLFRDRLLLLAFNKLVATNLQGYAALRRVRLPSWLRRGVFYRGNGRCISCGKDLSGANIMGELVHYDHILPLALHGSNDATNFQLLCSTCNQEKSSKASTSDRYPVFWALE